MRDSLWSRAFWSENRVIWAILLLTVILRIDLAFRSEPLLYSHYYQEDAFYLFDCAEHVAKGEGFTVDGIHPTNGVQPLIVILYAPLFWIAGFEKSLALRIGYCYAALFDALSAYFLYRLLRKLKRGQRRENSFVLARRPVLAALLYGLLHPVYVHTVSGLETGVLSMLLILTLLLYAHILERRENNNEAGLSLYLALGLLMGLTVLARIDACILVVMLALNELRLLRKKALLPALTLSATAFLVSLPWWAYNYSVFGNIIPQSGLSESMNVHVESNVLQTIGAVSDCFSVFFSVTKMVMMPRAVYILWFITVVAAYIICFRRWSLYSYLQRTYRLEIFLPVICASAVSATYYMLFFGAPHFIPRYLQPLRIIAITIGAIVIPFVCRRLYRYRLGKIAVWVLICAAMLNTTLRYPQNFLSKGYSSFYLAGKWALLHPQAKIGMYQSGAAGFMARNVINLDGKVNYQALLARQNHRIGKYVADEGIEYIADWAPLAKEVAADAEKYDAHFTLVDSLQEIMIYQRIISKNIGSISK